MVIFESLHTSLPFKASDTDVPELEKQANENALLLSYFTLQELFSDYCWCGFSLVNI